MFNYVALPTLDGRAAFPIGFMLKCSDFSGVVDGFNGTIFAYGQTGSGKSFTMEVGAII